jgi:hypothetical protein
VRVARSIAGGFDASLTGVSALALSIIGMRHEPEEEQ